MSDLRTMKGNDSTDTGRNMPTATEEIANIDVGRAKGLLRRLRNDPFIAIIISDGRVRIYSKDMSPDHLRKIREVLAEELGEEVDGKN